jgi:DNA-binding PadR family transcriptional regulator
MHPYEMGLVMRHRRKEEGIKFRYGSLYTVIDLLLARGFIAAGASGRDGRRPERTVYEITAAGRDELQAWMTDLIGEPAKDYPLFETALALLPVLPPDAALTLLHKRLTAIERNAGALAAQIGEAHERGLPPVFAVETEYRLALMEAEQRFVGDLIGRIESGWGPREVWRGLHDDRDATLTELYREFGRALMR